MKGDDTAGDAGPQEGEESGTQRKAVGGEKRVPFPLTVISLQINYLKQKEQYREDLWCVCVCVCVLLTSMFTQTCYGCDDTVQKKRSVGLQSGKKAASAVKSDYPQPV